MSIQDCLVISVKPAGHEKLVQPVAPCAACPEGQNVEGEKWSTPAFTASVSAHFMHKERTISQAQMAFSGFANRACMNTGISPE